MALDESTDDGYDIEEIIILNWEDRPGAEVRAMSMSTGEMMMVNAEGTAIREASAGTNAVMEHMADVLSRVVLSWNFMRTVKDRETGEVSREPVPTTREGALMLGHRLLLSVYRSYMGDAFEVESSSPLDAASPDGVSYPAELATMEPLSESPSS